MTPSRVKAISSPLTMRIPCSTTQKWYYLKGSEDKDVEYGRLFIAVAAPLSNVTGSSSTSLMIRMRWVFEFSFPDLPSASAPSEEIFASAPNYFSDSSSDFKEGKYLTFKWHEGGNIVSFPGAKTLSLYKIGQDSRVGYYLSNGVLMNTKFAVCVADTAGDGLPMLCPVKDEETGKKYIKQPADNLLISYSSAGPWVSPENPPWHEQSVSLSLVLTRHETMTSPLAPAKSVVTVYDDSVSHRLHSFRKDFGTVNALPLSDKRSPSYGLVTRTAQGVSELSANIRMLLAQQPSDHTDPAYGRLLTSLENLEELSFAFGGLKTFVIDPLRESAPSDTTESECSLLADAQPTAGPSHM
nr:MAG: coat protein [Wufeng shrew permutotetravirus 8]